MSGFPVRLRPHGASLLLLGVLSIPALAQSAPPRKVATTPHEALRGLALRAEDGTRVGSWELLPSETRLRIGNKEPLSAPRLERWLASPDGRTLVGAGDPLAPEHAFEWHLVVLRDGNIVLDRDERLSPESDFTIDAEGRVAVVGHVGDQRGKAFAEVLSPEGKTLFRQPLPAGAMGREPILFGETLWVRAHGVLDEGTGGSVLRIDAQGVSSPLDIPGSLSLVGFPNAGRGLVRTRNELTWFDLNSGRLLWRRGFDARPIGPSAWTLLDSPSRQGLAVLTRGLRRAGQPEPPCVLELYDTAGGAQLSQTQVEGDRRPSLVDLRSESGKLVVDWSDREEVFEWAR